MKRGELYRVFKPGADRRQCRVFVIVSRQALIESKFSSLACAPVLSSGQGLSTQVAVGPPEGLAHGGWIACDNLQSIAKTDLTDCVGSLSESKIVELNEALELALGLG